VVVIEWVSDTSLLTQTTPESDSDRSEYTNEQQDHKRDNESFFRVGGLRERIAVMSCRVVVFVIKKFAMFACEFWWTATASMSNNGFGGKII